MSDEIIGFVVERIADLIAQEVNLLRGAQNEFLSLQKELEMMQSFLIDVDAKLEAGDHRLRTIVKQIREMAYDIEDLIDSFLQKDVDRREKAKVSFLKRILHFYSHQVQTHQMGNQVEELRSRIRETIERLQTYQVRMDVEVIRKERPISYPRSIGSEHVVGFDNDVGMLVEKLINQDVKILAIVGMGGCGKTTMAKKIYNHTQIHSHFEHRAWVSVSHIWNQESLLKEILRQTTEQTGETLTVQTIVEEIHKSLQGKSYLIVLDDVWEQDVLRKIMVPTAMLYRSKFLITTRITEVVRFPDLGYYVHEPRRLAPEESWELFQKIAFGHQSNTIMDQESEPYVVLGQEMLRKCDGLPLAVVALAGLLSTKSTIQEWERVKSNMSSKINEEKVGPCEYGRVEDMLALSYLDLNYTLKSCFIYMGLFPEDVNIPTRELMQCWIGEGFFKSVQFAANDSIEDVAKRHLDELIQRCLVQVVRVNYAQAVKVIRVHDLMRDLAINRAKEMCFLDTIHSTSLTNDHPSTITGARTLQPRRLGVITKNLNDLLEGDQLYKGSRHLRSFVYLLPNLWSEMSLKNLFTHYPLLRVLILKCCRGTIMPDEIGNLIHLRHLQISYDHYIIHLPDSVKNLRNLLSFEYRYDVQVTRAMLGPSLNINQMKQLRYLRITCVFGIKDQETLNLHDLPNLKMLWNIRGGPWMMTQLKCLSPTVEKLSIIAIKKSEELDMMYECPSIVQDCLNSLKLSFETGEFQVQKLQHCNKLQKLDLVGVIAVKSVPLAFPPYVLVLVLRRSEIEDQDSFVAALVKLPYLKFLWLGMNAYIGSQLNFPENSMRYLQELTLWYLENLEEIHVKESAMPHLKSVDIRGCFRLKVIPQRLKNLRDDTEGGKQDQYDRYRGFR